MSSVDQKLDAHIKGLIRAHFDYVDTSDVSSESWDTNSLAWSFVQGKVIPALVDHTEVTDSGELLFCDSNGDVLAIMDTQSNIIIPDGAGLTLYTPKDTGVESKPKPAATKALSGEDELHCDEVAGVCEPEPLPPERLQSLPPPEPRGFESDDYCDETGEHYGSSQPDLSHDVQRFSESPQQLLPQAVEEEPEAVLAPTSNQGQEPTVEESPVAEAVADNGAVDEASVEAAGKSAVSECADAEATARAVEESVVQLVAQYSENMQISEDLSNDLSEKSVEAYVFGKGEILSLGDYRASGGIAGANVAQETARNLVAGALELLHSGDVVAEKIASSVESAEFVYTGDAVPAMGIETGGYVMVRAFDIASDGVRNMEIEGLSEEERHLLGIEAEEGALRYLGSRIRTSEGHGEIRVNMFAIGATVFAVVEDPAEAAELNAKSGRTAMPPPPFVAAVFSLCGAGDSSELEGVPRANPDEQAGQDNGEGSDKGDDENGQGDEDQDEDAQE